MQFHVDAANLLIVLLAFAGIWVRFLRKDATQAATLAKLAEWSQKHDSICKEIRDANTRILTELQVSNAALVQIAEASIHRIDRLERLQDAAATAGKG
jgi:hypothetical protein